MIGIFERLQIVFSFLAIFGVIFHFLKVKFEAEDLDDYVAVTGLSFLLWGATIVVIFILYAVIHWIIMGV